MPESYPPESASLSAIPQRIGSLYNFRSHFFNLGRYRLHYLDEGSGKPVLLLHGNPSWSFMYRDLVRELRPFCRAIAPDHLGCGLSSVPSEEDYSFTLDRRVEDLGRFIDSLALTEPFDLVMHDWGGLIGTAWAVRNPERVARLVVLNTAAFRVPPQRRLHWTLRICTRSRLAALLIRGANAFSMAAVRLGTRRALPAAVKEGYLAPYSDWEHRIAVLRFVQDIPLDSTHPSFETVLETERGLGFLSGHPLLICWGMGDFIFDNGFLDRWIKFFPQARVHRFPEAGHYVLEDAGDRVIPLIKEFLQERA